MRAHTPAGVSVVDDKRISAQNECLMRLSQPSLQTDPILTESCFYGSFLTGSRPKEDVFYEIL